MSGGLELLKIEKRLIDERVAKGGAQLKWWYFESCVFIITDKARGKGGGRQKVSVL